MSHLHERTEKTCLNCGATLAGRYCHICGQENIEPKESFWHLLGHFLADLTHFDGKLFITLKYLLFKPGFLTEEYIKGRRASYLNPIRMYLFISALFFLLFMTFWLPQRNSQLQVQPKKSTNFSIKSTTHSIREGLDKIAPDTTWTPKTLKQYDSVQQALPVNERDDQITRYMARKTLSAVRYSHDNPNEFWHKFLEKFFHTLPYVLFVSVPIIALWLQLLYIRRRKQYFYVSHIIFTLHYYCLVFIALIISYSLKSMGDWSHYVTPFIALGFFIYLYAAMLRFYKQGGGKTFLKFLILLFVGIMSISLLVSISAMNSMFTIAS